MDLWLLITEDLPSVVLGRLDQVHLEELMVCHKQLRALRPKWMAAPEDKMLRCQYLDVQKQLMRLGDMFGMSPGSRAQMTMPDTSSEESPMLHLVSKFG